MKPLSVALTLTVWLSLGAAPLAAAPPTNPDAAIAAVQNAPDPMTAADAYERGLELGADRMALNLSYMYRMIELGVPGQAEAAAEEIIEFDPENGVAWAVLAFCDAARNDTTAALSEIAMAVDFDPDDPFVLGVAGKLMAWYRFPGLGDPAELPEGLPEHLHEIHDAYITNDIFHEAFTAAWEYYASQEGEPIPEHPAEFFDAGFEELYEPGFEEFVYDPVLFTTYNEYVYSGFAIPSFSYAYVVPRVRTYVLYERPIHRYLRFSIGGRYARYHSPVHVRRLAYHRVTRHVGYHLSARVRICPRPGFRLPPPRPRYVRAHYARGPVNPRFSPTRPPPPTPRHALRRFSASATTARPVNPRISGGLRRPAAGATAPTSPRVARPWTRTETPAARTRPSARPTPGARPQAWPQARPQTRPDGRATARPQTATRVPRAQPGRPQTGARAPGIQPSPQARPDARPQIGSRSPVRTPRSQVAPQPGGALRSPERSAAPSRTPGIQRTPRSGLNTPAQPQRIVRPQARPQTPSAAPRVQAPRPRTEMRPQARMQPQRIARPQPRAQPQRTIRPQARPQSPLAAPRVQAPRPRTEMRPQPRMQPQRIARPQPRVQPQRTIRPPARSQSPSWLQQRSQNLPSRTANRPRARTQSWPQGRPQLPSRAPAMQRAQRPSFESRSQQRIQRQPAVRGSRDSRSRPR